MTTRSATPEMLAAAFAECCISTEQPLGDEQAAGLAGVFRALGDPTRVKLYSLIAAASPGEVCACDLTESVGLSQSTVSHHLKLLVNAGVITREQRGRWAYYQPSPAVLTAAARALTGA